MPMVFETGAVTSVLDAVRDPAWLARLRDFDSLLAESQTSGRGQYRRHWVSPRGNLHVALRLPLSPPFVGTEAAVALGAWLCQALREEGFPCLLKWPNDLVLPLGDEARKVGGILLEERGDVLFAGIGINVARAPEEEALRADHALLGTSLATFAGGAAGTLPTCRNLWERLVNHVFFYYNNKDMQLAWRQTANRLLLWRNRSVVLTDGDSSCSGVLRETGLNGELVLEAQGEIRTFLSGSLALAR